MKELMQISQAVIDALSEAGVQAMAAFPPERVKQYDGAVAAVSVGTAEGKAVGFCNYLGQVWDEEAGTVEELYGVTFNYIEDYGTTGSAKTKLMVAATAGDDDYDAAVIAAYDAVPLAMAGSLYELGSIKNLTLDKDFWDERASRDLTIRGLLFATTGDIDFWDDMMQNVIAFNKQVKADLNIEDNFYTLVEDGKWTMDALASYAKQATEDLNSDGVYDMSDKFGLITWDDSIYAVLEGSGERVVQVADDGTLNPHSPAVSVL